MARREKKPVHKVVMTEGKRQIIRKMAACVILGISCEGKSAAG